MIWSESGSALLGRLFYGGKMIIDMHKLDYRARNNERIANFCVQTVSNEVSAFPLFCEFAK